MFHRACRYVSILASVVLVTLSCATAEAQLLPEPGAPEPVAETAPAPEESDAARLAALERSIAALERRASAAEAREAQAAAALAKLRGEHRRLAAAMKRRAALDVSERKAAAAKAAAEAEAGPSADLDGYIEANYSYNFNRPRNGITNFRGFDNRHDSITLSNAVLGGTFDYQSLTGRLALQIGHTPSTYYLAEPLSPGAGGAASSGAEVFKYVQQAHIGWDPFEDGSVLVQAGIFLSPIGFEGIAVKDNWNWSRSNLFFGLPFYHTGVMASFTPLDAVTGKVMVSNGWNSVVDNNFWKSVEAQWIVKPVPELTLSLLYFTGVERPRLAPEGEPWRHLFDAWAQVDATDYLSFALHGDAGFEPHDLGTSWWAAGAAYARVKPMDWLYLAGRADLFREEAAEDEAGLAASRVFWPADLLGSATVTADIRPNDNLSLRVEYRHDHADADMFFAGEVDGDGVTTPFVPDEDSQDTLTVGATGWF